MTTATARSARPGIGRSVPLENGENGFELGAQVLDGLGRERAARLRLQVPAAPILLDLLARPLDRVFLGVEQMLHQHDQLDLAPLIRSEEHTSELQSRLHLVCRLLLEKKKKNTQQYTVNRYGKHHD